MPTQRVLLESEPTGKVDFAKHPIGKNLNKGFVIGYNKQILLKNLLQCPGQSKRY